MSAPTMLAEDTWQDRAACKGTRTEDWWLENTGDQVPAEHFIMCALCPVRLECALHAKRERSTGVIRAGVACHESAHRGATRAATLRALDGVIERAAAAAGAP